MYYVAKTVRDVDGDITGYTFAYKSTDKLIPRSGDYAVFFHKEDFAFALIEQDLGCGEWVVVEDTTKKTEESDKKTKKNQRRRELKDKIAVIEQEFIDAKTVAQLKAVIGPVLKKILQEVMND